MNLHWREQQVLELLAHGCTNEEIGAVLFLGVNTIKTYLKRLYASLGAVNKAHAVHLGHVHGLLGGTES